MTTRIADKFISLPVDKTRCPERIRALAPTATRIYLLKERFDCRYWTRVSDCFYRVRGVYIVAQPAAARRYFTLEPRKVIRRLHEAGVW